MKDRSLPLTETEAKTILSALEEVAVERKQLLERELDHFTDLDALLKAYEPGSFGNHEALDRAHVVNSQWNDFVLEHPTVILNKQAFRAAQLAGYLMGLTYQLLGRVQ